MNVCFNYNYWFLLTFSDFHKLYKIQCLLFSGSGTFYVSGLISMYYTQAEVPGFARAILKEIEF